MGKTTFVLNALEIRRYWYLSEFTGTILAYFLKWSSKIKQTKEYTEPSAEGLAEQYDMTLLETDGVQ